MTLATLIAVVLPEVWPPQAHVTFLPNDFNLLGTATRSIAVKTGRPHGTPNGTCASGALSPATAQSLGSHAQATHPPCSIQPEVVGNTQPAGEER